MWRYTEALEAQVVAEAGVDPNEVVLHSARIGAATTLAAGGEGAAEGVPEIRCRWKFSESS